MSTRFVVALLVAVGLAGSVSAQRFTFSTVEQAPGPIIEEPLFRFTVVASQPVNGAILTVVKDNALPNRPCLYLLQGPYNTQMLPTPGGVCG